MKKIITLCLCAAFMLGACNNKEKDEQLAQAQAVADATREELQEAVTDRDQLLTLVTEISSGMQQIKELEKILVKNSATETPDQRQQIKDDIAAIQQTLIERRQKLEDLERRLSKSRLANSNLEKTIASLREQIDQQASEISSLRENLSAAQHRIGALDAQVDSLHTTVTSVTAAKDSAQVANAKLTTELNTCYYAIGNKKELKDNRIIETGFLKKTKLMDGDFDRSFFTTADKRKLTTIDLNSKKAEILTKHPASSYSIVDQNGHKVLKITSPSAFWSLSNYLVVKID